MTDPTMSGTDDKAKTDDKATKTEAKKTPAKTKETEKEKCPHHGEICDLAARIFIQKVSGPSAKQYKPTGLIEQSWNEAAEFIKFAESKK